jgi:hypothetical protein
MLENGRFLLIRADGGSDIGLGHLFRTLALAEAWAAKGGKLRLVSGSCPPSLAARFRELGTVMDATLTGAMECVGAENAAAIVLDTKHADEAWQIIADALFSIKTFMRTRVCIHGPRRMLRYYWGRVSLCCGVSLLQCRSAVQNGRHGSFSLSEEPIP